MTARYRQQLFTAAVKSVQETAGSRRAYARTEDVPADADRLGGPEAAFIVQRDSFYMATISASGWPYLQHRGGPRGFVKVLSERQLGFADYRGNLQYVSVGNLADDARAAFFFMDYANRARLKLLGRVRSVDLTADAELRASLSDDGYGAVVERGLVVDIDAFDWNCPQHIVERFTIEEITPAIDQLKGRIAELEDELAALRGKVA